MGATAAEEVVEGARPVSRVWKGYASDPVRVSLIVRKVHAAAMVAEAHVALVLQALVAKRASA